MSVLTRSQDVKSMLKKVEAGVTATKAIMDIMADEKFSDSFKKIRKIAEHTGPFLGAIGPVIALVGIFLPQAPSRELRLIKKKNLQKLMQTSIEFLHNLVR